MKKLTLELDELKVESFETSVPATERGTVQGFDESWSDNSVCPGVTERGQKGCYPY